MFIHIATLAAKFCSFAVFWHFTGWCPYVGRVDYNAECKRLYNCNRRIIGDFVLFLCDLGMSVSLLLLSSFLWMLPVCVSKVMYLSLCISWFFNENAWRNMIISISLFFSSYIISYNPLPSLISPISPLLLLLPLSPPPHHPLPWRPRTKVSLIPLVIPSSRSSPTRMTFKFCNCAWGDFGSNDTLRFIRI